jgi:DNA-binding NarL/FixJ family response regulator
VLVAAVDALRGSPRRLIRAEACELAGRALSDAGDGDGDASAARALLEEAVELYDGCGAWRDRARVAGMIRAAGGRVRRTKAARDGNPLSPSEQAVARLVTEGLSNPEIAKRLFISRRTVETHLRRVFAKLGFSSRVELAMWVERNVR